MGDLDKNLFRAAYDTLNRCLGIAAIIVALIMLVSVLELYYPHLSEGTEIGSAIGWSLLSYYAHAEFLSPQPRDKTVDGQRSGGFVWRSCILVLLALVPGIAAGYGMISLIPGGNQSEVVVFLSITLMTWLSYTVIMATFGTMLPAYIVQKNAGIMAAYRRSRLQFRYCLLRLMLFAVPLTLLSLFILVLPAIFNYSTQLVMENGRFNHAAISAYIAGLAVNAYAITLTSVILCRSYILAESKN